MNALQLNLSLEKKRELYISILIYMHARKHDEFC